MQSTARCANCGCTEFEYEPPTRHLRGEINLKPGGIQTVIQPPFAFGKFGIVDNCVPQLCCTACGYWEKTWSPARERPPQLAGADQAMAGTGHVPGNMVPAQD